MVKIHLHYVYRKLGVSNRLELALYVIKQRGVGKGSDFGRVLLTERAPKLGNGDLTQC